MFDWFLDLSKSVKIMVVCVASIILVAVGTHVVLENKHKHEYVDEIISPTCVSQGFTLHMCECGKAYKDTYVNSLGHKEVTDAGVEVTCLVDGLTSGKHCSVCDEILVEQTVIKAKGHVKGQWIVDFDAKCKEDGSMHQICSVCEETIKTEVIPEKGHTQGEWIVDFDAKCEEDGSKHQICSVCEETIKTEVLPKEGHDYSETVENKSLVKFECGKCLYSYDKQVENITVTVVLSGIGTSFTHSGVRYERSFSVTAKGGHGQYNYKYEVFQYKSSGEPVLVKDFCDSRSYGYYGNNSLVDNTVLKVTVIDEIGNKTICRVYGSGTFIDSWTE